MHVSIIGIVAVILENVLFKRIQGAMSGDDWLESFVSTNFRKYVHRLAKLRYKWYLFASAPRRDISDQFISKCSVLLRHPLHLYNALS